MTVAQKLEDVAAKATIGDSGSVAGERAEGQFNPYVHGARGLFAMMVFLFHIANSGLPNYALTSGAFVKMAFLSLQFGVELFFGISGIVIIGALARSPGFLSFAWDRITRILPVLWATLLTISVLSLLFHRPLPSFGIWLANFFPPPPMFLISQVNPAAWSLGYEFAFYFLAGLAWLLRQHRTSFRLLCLGGLALVVLFPRAILMIPGILIALGMIEKKGSPRFKDFPGLMLALFLLCWTVVSLVQFEDPERLLVFGPYSTPFSEWLLSLPLMLLGGLLGTLALAGIAEGRGMLSRLLVTSPLLWLGTVSYSFYLWHPVVLAIAKQGMKSTGLIDALGSSAQLGFCFVGLPAVLIVSAISQRFLEARLTRWLRRFGPRKMSMFIDPQMAVRRRRARCMMGASGVEGDKP